jgi:hypothetical protein
MKLALAGAPCSPDGGIVLAAPYEVRWSDGQESVLFPSSDCSVTKARADEKDES